MSRPRFIATFFRHDRIVATRPCDDVESAPSMAHGDLRRCDRIAVTLELPILDGSGAIFIRVRNVQATWRWPFVRVSRVWVRQD